MAGWHLPSVEGAIPHIWSHIVSGQYPDGGADCAVCDASLDDRYIGARPSTLAALSPNADAAALAAECKRLEAEARRLHIAAREASTSPILRDADGSAVGCAPAADEAQMPPSMRSPTGLSPN